MRRRIERRRSGEIVVQLPPEERELLRALPGQLRELLAEDDPSLARLFPPAYGDDADANAAYDELVRDEHQPEEAPALGSGQPAQARPPTGRIRSSKRHDWRITT
jgi:hypothetical protein